MDNLERAVVEIIIEAKNQAHEGILGASGDLEGLRGTAMHVGEQLALVGVGMVGLGVGLAGAIAGLVATAGEFDSKLVAVRNNTTMTDSDFNVMRDTVLRLAAEAPVSFDALSEGFMHVTNFGFGAKDAVLVLDAAMKSAVSTGGDTAKTAEVLAAVMHEFNIPASQAAATMDLLHTAAAEGNMTLEQFSNSFGQVAAWASSVGVPLDQAAAAFSAMTRHGFDAAEAGTQVKDLFEHIIKPSKGAETALLELSRASGVDLTNAFSSTELHSKGLTGILDEVKGAMTRAGMTADEQTAMWMRLVPNIRGGSAAFILAGNGAADMTNILHDLHTNLGVTDAAFDRMKQTFSFQWGVLKNQLSEIAITLGEALMPAVRSVLDYVTPLIGKFAQWAKEHGDLIAKVAVGVTVFLTLGGALLTVAGVVTMVAASLSPVGLAIAALVLGAGALAVAWETNWNGIREKTVAAWIAIQPVIEHLQALVKGLVEAATKALSGDWADAWKIAAGAVTDWERFVLDELEQFGPRVLRWVADRATDLVRQFGEWATAFVAWVVPAGERFLAEWPDTLNHFLDWIEAAVPPIAAQLLSWAQAFVAWVGPHIPDILLALAGVLAALVVFIAETVVTINLRLAAWGLAFVGWVATQVVPKLPGALLAIATAIGTFALDFIAKISEYGGKWAGGLVTGLVDGIGSLGSQLMAAIGNQLRSLDFRIGPFHISGGGISIDTGGITGGGGGTGSGGTGSGAHMPAGAVAGPNAMGQYEYQVVADGGRSVSYQWRDTGGSGMAGSPYAIGVPELFVPQTGGDFVPLHGAEQALGRLGGRGGTVVNLSVDVHDNQVRDDRDIDALTERVCEQVARKFNTILQH